MKRQTLIVICLGAILGVVMTWPMMRSPGTLARMDTYDGKFSVWNVAWVSHALVDDPANVFNANIFHPHTGTLAYSEANLVAGLLGAPVYAISRNPVLTHNLVVYFALVLAFVLTWMLVRRLTGSALAGLAPAAAFAFAPYISAHTAHIQLLMVFVVPLVLLALHRFVEAATLWRAAQLGLSLAIGGLACAYYGLMMGLAVGVGALWFGPGHAMPKRYWLGLVLAALVAIAVVAPALAPYASLRNEEGFRSALNLEEAAGYSADHRAFMNGQSGAFTRLLPETWRAGINNYVGRTGEVLFPGLVIVALALVGGLTSRTQSPRRRIMAFYAVLTLLALWASLGPKAGLYTVLAEWIPFMSFLRAPARMGVLVLFGLAVFAGVGVAWLEVRRRILWLAPLLMVLVAVELRASWPLREVPPVADAYRMLAALPRAAVLVMHFPYRPGAWFPHADYMFWSMYHWQPMINGYSDFIPADIRALAVPINGFPNDEAFALLRERDVRYVVIDWRTYTEEATAVMRARFPPYAQYLRPLVTTGPASLYEVIGWPETGVR